jgi:hypothetical protein
LEDENRSLRSKIEKMQQQQLLKQTQLEETQRLQQQWSQHHHMPPRFAQGEQSMQSPYNNSSQLPNHMPAQLLSPQYQQQTQPYAHNVGFTPNMMGSMYQTQQQWNTPPILRNRNNVRPEILSLMSSSIQSDNHAAAMYYGNVARDSNANIYNNTLSNNRANMQTLSAMYMNQSNEY